MWWSEDNQSEPLDDVEIDAIRGTLRFYHRDSLVPRLIATIDALGDIIEQRS